MKKLIASLLCLGYKRTGLREVDYQEIDSTSDNIGLRACLNIFVLSENEADFG